MVGHLTDHITSPAINARTIAASRRKGTAIIIINAAVVVVVVGGQWK